MKAGTTSLHYYLGLHPQIHMSGHKELDYYPRERIHVLSAEQLKNDRLETLRRVFRFLGVDDTFADDNFSKTLYESGAKIEFTRLGNLAAKLPYGRRLIIKTRKILPRI